MIEVNGLIIQADGEQILNELQRQLRANGSPLLSHIKPGNRNIQFTCIAHANGMERRPSAGLSLQNVMRGGKLIPAGTVHCFTCGYTASLTEFISTCFGYQDAGMFGNRWLRKNFGGVEVFNRESIKLELDRSKKNTAEVKYISEEELEKYAYYHDYMFYRGLTEEIIDMFDIGFDKVRQCLTMPVHDLEGRVPFIQTRSVNTKFHHYEKDVMKTEYIYGLYECLQYYPDAPRIKVCESILNALSFWVQGIPAVALMGTGGGSQYNILKNCKYRILDACLDPDDAGRQATMRLKRNVRNKLIYSCIYPDKRDINDLHRDKVNLNSLEYRLI